MEGKQITICLCGKDCGGATTDQCPCRANGVLCSVHCKCQGTCHVPVPKTEVEVMDVIVPVNQPVEPEFRVPYKGRSRNKAKQLYYALYIDGRRITITDVTNDGKKWPRDKTAGFCCAWVEGKSTDVFHYFYIPLRMYFILQLFSLN